jgi:hypothetical protein
MDRWSATSGFLPELRYFALGRFVPDVILQHISPYLSYESDRAKRLFSFVVFDVSRINRCSYCVFTSTCGDIFASLHGCTSQCWIQCNLAILDNSMLCEPVASDIISNWHDVVCEWRAQFRRRLGEEAAALVSNDINLNPSMLWINITMDMLRCYPPLPFNVVTRCV